MGTYVSISIFDRHFTEPQLAVAMTQAFAAVDEVEAVASHQNLASDVNQLCRQAGTGWIPVDPVLFQIIHSGCEIAAQTAGAFDPTIAPICDLWGFGAAQPHKPDRLQIEKMLPLVNYRNVDLDSPRVQLRLPAMSLDLGGIAKGAAVDAAVRELERNGLRNFMVDAGGDLAIRSSRLTHGKIRVWIRHPRKSDGFFAYFMQDSGSVATSGDYEQYFEAEGQRFCHLINPKNGYPDSDLISVTVRTATTEVADALATALFVMGWEKAVTFVQQHPQLEVVLLKAEGNKIHYWASAGLLKKIQIVDDSLL